MGAEHLYAGGVTFGEFIDAYAAAIQWRFEGGLIDAWDAYLWLTAFVFSEMNSFDWHGEEATD